MTAQTFSMSPLFTGRSQFNSISSSFSYSYASIFYFQNIRELSLNFNTFSFILSSAVYISSEDQENKRFNKRFSDSGELSKIKISNCLFLKCVSKENGGGIFIGSKTSDTDFTLQSTGFKQCQSKNGDAFYSETRSITCQSCCIDNCINSAFYANEKKTLNFQSNFISNSKLNSNIKQSPQFKFESVNLSFNTDSIHITTESVHDFEVVITDCELNSNAGEDLFVVSLPYAIDFSIQNTIFQNNNFAHSIVNVKDAPFIRLVECYFKEDNSKYYLLYPSRSTFQVRDCYFSDTETKEQSKFLTTFRCFGCKYDNSITTKIIFSDTHQCWNKMPKTLPPIHLDSKTIFTFGAVIILVVGFIFIVIKLKNRNRYGNQMTYMYTK